MLKPHTAIFLSLRRSFDFKGRSRRSEFWWFWAFTIFAYVALVYIDDWIIPEIPEGVGDEEYGLQGWVNAWRLYPISQAFDVLTILPYVAVGIRRLHDIGRRGWPMLAFFMSDYIVGYINPLKANYDIEKAVDINPELYPFTYLNVLSLPYLILGIVCTGLTFYMIYVGLRDGQKHPNQYGPSAKYGDPVLAF